MSVAHEQLHVVAPDDGDGRVVGGERHADLVHCVPALASVLDALARLLDRETGERLSRRDRFEPVDHFFQGMLNAPTIEKQHRRPVVAFGAEDALVLNPYSDDRPGLVLVLLLGLTTAVDPDVDPERTVRQEHLREGVDDQALRQVDHPLVIPGEADRVPHLIGSREPHARAVHLGIDVLGGQSRKGHCLESVVEIQKIPPPLSLCDREYRAPL